MTTEVPQRQRDYPVVERDDSTIRAFREQVLGTSAAAAGWSTCARPASTPGELLAMPDYPPGGALRGGRIPGAANVPWKRAANEDGTFKAAEELRAIYEGELGLANDDDIVAYCPHRRPFQPHLVRAQPAAQGSAGAHFHDGSWVEWGNSVRGADRALRRPGPDPRLKAVG